MYGETSLSADETTISVSITERPYARRACIYCILEHSNSGKKVSIRFDSILATESIFFDSIRFGNLINLPLVHLYSNSKLGLIL